VCHPCRELEAASHRWRWTGCTLIGSGARRANSLLYSAKAILLGPLSGSIATSTSASHSSPVNSTAGRARVEDTISDVVAP